MVMTFKVGEEQTVVFDIEIEGLDYDLETDTDLSLAVADQDGNILFTKNDDDFSKYPDLDEVRVKFYESDLSDSGSYLVELRIDIYIDEMVGWIEKSKDMKMYIRRSLT